MIPGRSPFWLGPKANLKPFVILDKLTHEEIELLPLRTKPVVNRAAVVAAPLLKQTVRSLLKLIEEVLRVLK